ncbi:polysaccharide deacetylase family protein [Salinimicrobium terrae]|uniref:polysaccharide deacetylase family protein n=1 Tax=Salinimicrobium terrae TaxID=470866 RepID=UPI00040200E8|nr:polysaccharide deacetylase family protein [Salinimicrobium terrae]
MRERIPAIIKWIYPRRIWDGPAGEKVLYLTFDDGPVPQVTPWVLEQLGKYNAKATFFCIGENVERYPEIFRQVIKEGHVVGNHTYSHLNGWKTSVEEYIQNSLQARETMENELPQGTEFKNPLFRPPYGRIKNVQAKRLQQEGFRIVMWSIVSRDYDRTLSPEKCLQNVLNNVRPGSIIVFHDSFKAEKNMKKILPEVLKHYKNSGFCFKGLK